MRVPAKRLLNLQRKAIHAKQTTPFSTISARSDSRPGQMSASGVSEPPGIFLNSNSQVGWSPYEISMEIRERAVPRLLDQESEYPVDAKPAPGQQQLTPKAAAETVRYRPWRDLAGDRGPCAA